MAEFSASLSYSRVGAQKARLVADLVRGKSVDRAAKVLAFTPKKTAVLLKKLLQSAVANAEQKGVKDIDSLYIKKLCIDIGPSLRRFRPRAQGRATPIKRKTSHMTIVIEER